MALFGCLPEKGANGDFKQYEGLEIIMQVTNHIAIHMMAQQI